MDALAECFKLRTLSNLVKEQVAVPWGELLEMDVIVYGNRLRRVSYNGIIRTNGEKLVIFEDDSHEINHHNHMVYRLRM